MLPQGALLYSRQQQKKQTARQKQARAQARLKRNGRPPPPPIKATGCLSWLCGGKVPRSPPLSKSSQSNFLHCLSLTDIMGQTLSEPVTKKQTSSCENAQMKVASSSMQGWRINMEDAHTHLLSLQEDKDAAFFAVYDGHGGAKVAEYAESNVHHRIANHPAYWQGNYIEAIKYGFLQVDQDMQQDEALRDELAGTTAVACLLRNSKIYCGNVGDSRAIASVRGAIQQLSFDHKPSNEAEAKRIIAAGGWVEFNRVNGNLALSRALGDFVFKRNDEKSAEEQIVTALPDVTVKDLTQDHEFMILACDGIWDVLSNEEVIEFVRTRLSKEMEPTKICEELITHCLAPDCSMGGLGCDNMTVIVVCFLNGKSVKDLAQKCSRPATGIYYQDNQEILNNTDSTSSRS